MFENKFCLWSIDGEPQKWPERYGDWWLHRSTEEPTHATLKYLTVSDYSGSLIEYSNILCWQEEFADSEEEAWVTVSGGHGTLAIVVKLDALTVEMKEFLEGLEDYPLYSDDRHTDLEMEAQDRAWRDWAREDFAKALEKVTGDEFDPEQPGLIDAFYQGMEAAGLEWLNEQGFDVWVDVEKVAKALHLRRAYVDGRSGVLLLASPQPTLDS